MSTADVGRQLEAEDLARAKELTEGILRNWDFITWNELLADDVVFSLRMALVGIDRISDLDTAGGNLQVTVEEMQAGLESIYGDIKRGLWTSEIFSGYDMALLGNFAPGFPAKSWPIAIYMGFNDDSEISVMSIVAVDPQPLTDGMPSAAQSGALKAA